MPVFDQLQKASFDGIPFPVKSVQVSGGLRDHVHEYPHSPGGAVEKLGRKLYTIQMEGIFDVKLSGYGDNLWPGDLSDLRDRFEDQTTSDLYIPTIGNIQAYAVTWTQTANTEMVSGEMLSVEFREDQAQAFLFEGLINITSTTLKSAGQQFDDDFDPLLAGGTLDATAPTRIRPPPAGTKPRATTAAGAYTQLRERDATALQKIRDAYRYVQTIADQPDRYAGQVLNTADILVTTCEQWYDKIRVLKNPLAHRQARSFKRVWSSAQKLRDSVAGKRSRILFYRAGTDTSIHAISRAVYGNTSYITSILQLNAIPDPFLIPKDTVVRYYDPNSIAEQAA
jgi:hypothetical protein